MHNEQYVHANTPAQCSVLLLKLLFWPGMVFDCFACSTSWSLIMLMLVLMLKLVIRDGHDHAYACSYAQSCPQGWSIGHDHAHACSNTQTFAQGWPPTILHACPFDHLCRGYSISQGLPLNSHLQHYADDDFWFHIGGRLVVIQIKLALIQGWNTFPLQGSISILLVRGFAAAIQVSSPIYQNNKLAEKSQMTIALFDPHLIRRYAVAIFSLAGGNHSTALAESSWSHLKIDYRITWSPSWRWRWGRTQ